MRNILLIDDLRIFKPTYDLRGANLHIARNSLDALTILKEKVDMEWDEIWFDHDLGMVQGKEDTTLPVADYLSERAFFDDPVSIAKVIIHTSNPVGARALTSTLQRYGYRIIRVQAERCFDIDMSLY